MLWYSDRNQCFFSRNVVAESSCSRPAAQSQSVQQIGISLLLFCAGFHSNIPSYKLYLLKSCCAVRAAQHCVEKRVRDFFVWVMMMRIYSHAQKQHKIKQGIFSPWLFFLYDNNTSRLDLTATRLDDKVPYRASTPLHSPLLCFENFSLFFLINILLNRLSSFSYAPWTMSCRKSMLLPPSHAVDDARKFRSLCFNCSTRFSDEKKRRKNFEIIMRW